MPNIIDDLCAFVEHGEISTDLAPSVRLVGALRLRGIAIELLWWLQFQRRWGPDKPLRLNWRHFWCCDLRIVLSPPGPLHQLLEIDGESCSFRNSVSAEEQDRCRDAAHAGYHPRLRTTMRR